jgi:hypothetical protein
VDDNDRKILEQIEQKLDQLIALYNWRAALTLSAPTQTEATVMPAKKLKVGSGAPVNMTDIQTDGAILGLVDGAGNPVGTIDPTKVTAVWSSTDPTILAVAPNATNPLAATISTVGTPPKLGTASIIATLTFTTPPPAPLPATLTATSPPITVTASAPASADITLGTPTP